MKIKSNHFALVPVMCTECQRYIFMEPYRNGEKWDNLIDRFLKVRICRDCYKKFTFGNK